MVNLENHTWGKSAGMPQGRSRLVNLMMQWIAGKHLVKTAVPGMEFHCWPSPTEPTSYMFSPHLCLIAQGVKRIVLGEESYVYDANSFVVSSVELPLVSHVIEASPEVPYIGLTLELDVKEVSQIIVDGEVPDDRQRPMSRGIVVSRMNQPLLNAVERLVELLDTPQDIPMFLPLIRREIYYRLLMDPQGYRLRHIAMAESHSYQIARAIDWMKKNFDQPLRIQELATFAGMSSSSFHQHFRALTSISPLQFQKRIRLNEARRLMLVEKMDAGNAGFRVGYESSTQFTREYKRMFGKPPRTDIRRLENVRETGELSV